MFTNFGDRLDRAVESCHDFLKEGLKCLVLNNYFFLLIIGVLFIWQLNVRGFTLADVEDLKIIFKAPIETFHTDQVRSFLSESMLFNFLGYMLAPRDECGLVEYLALFVLAPTLAALVLLAARAVDMTGFANLVAAMVAFPIMIELFLWMGKPDSLIVAAFILVIFLRSAPAIILCVALVMLNHAYFGILCSAYLIARTHLRGDWSKARVIAIAAGSSLLLTLIFKVGLYYGASGRTDFLVDNFLEILRDETPLAPITVAGALAGGWTLLMLFLSAETDKKVRLLDILYLAGSLFVAAILTKDATRVGVLFSGPLVFSMVADLQKRLRFSAAWKSRLPSIRVYALVAALITAHVPQVWSRSMIIGQQSGLEYFAKCALGKDPGYFGAHRFLFYP